MQMMGFKFMHHQKESVPPAGIKLYEVAALLVQVRHQHVQHTLLAGTEQACTHDRVCGMERHCLPMNGAAFASCMLHQPALRTYNSVLMWWLLQAGHMRVEEILSYLTPSDEDAQKAQVSREALARTEVQVERAVESKQASAVSMYASLKLHG